VERDEAREACVLIERAALGRYIRHMWLSGRVLVPVNGWYEWMGDNKNRLPWYVRLKNNKTMFLAGVTNYVPDSRQTAERGVAIIADPSTSGLVDPGYLRPVVFTSDFALQWLDPRINRDEAIYLASKYSRPPDDFEWYRVGTAVNKVDIKGELDWDATKALIEPI
jgi:putative SOS response-associated peptidase YedK